MSDYQILNLTKATLQSNIYAYESLAGAFVSLVRLGPSELLRGFMASSLRDAPYAGLFVVFYEGIKRESCTSFTSLSVS
jgi:solute carrier family 25, member 38